MEIGKKETIEWASKTSVPILVVFFCIMYFVDVIYPKYFKGNDFIIAPKDFYSLINKAEANERQNNLQDMSLKEIRLECLQEARATRSYIQEMQSDLAVIKHKLGIKN